MNLSDATSESPASNSGVSAQSRYGTASTAPVPVGAWGRHALPPPSLETNRLRAARSCPLPHAPQKQWPIPYKVQDSMCQVHPGLPP
ncbi:hypothetical protein J6590_004602 [Homalodisca vitripennis]|nr:hypothetical protein J6590_004602 [Homalodisca vitripennis]